MFNMENKAGQQQNGNWNEYNENSVFFVSIYSAPFIAPWIVVVFLCCVVFCAAWPSFLEWHSMRHHVRVHYQLSRLRSTFMKWIALKICRRTHRLTRTQGHHSRWLATYPLHPVYTSSFLPLSLCVSLILRVLLLFADFCVSDGGDAAAAAHFYGFSSI